MNEIDIEQLQVGTQTMVREETMKSKEKINLIDLVYDLNEHKVIEYDENEIDIDYVNVAGLGSVIHHAIRGELIDKKVNAQYNEYNNYYTAGKYSDMPGTEEIVKILNSIDGRILSEYFKKYPEDIALFEEMKDKYPEIQSLEENEKSKDARQLFEESLLRDDIVEYYLSKTPEELETEFSPEVARMVGFEQRNSHHCYDLWGHTLHTVASVDTTGLTEEQVRKLKVAAFFHDIGKPDVSKFNETTGQQVFYGHAVHSVEVAKPLLVKLGYSEQEIEQLSFFIGHHDDFISYKNKLAPYMKNHEFIREIDSKTVAEKVIENKFDFESMGYDKDQIRAICYTLAHGKDPEFRTKDGPITININIDEVQQKMDSGEYDSRYDATLEDYQMLLQLCKADARAQSEVAMQKGANGKTFVAGSKAEKLEAMSNIESNIPEAYKDAVEKTGYSFEQFIKDSVPQAFGAKRPLITCKDGTEYSIQASSFHACSPRKDGLEAYDEFEVYPISDWKGLEDYMNYDKIAANVPLKVVEEVLRKHGGLDKAIMKERVLVEKDALKPKDTDYERLVQEVSGGNEFIANIFRYATRKIQLTEQTTKAKTLLNEYEQQLPANQQSLNED